MKLVALTPLATVAPGALTNPQVATVGMSATAMHADAKAGIPNPAIPSTQAFGDTATSGAGTGFATDTHKHAMPVDPHIEAKRTAGSASSESVTWTVAYAAAPVIIAGVESGSTDVAVLTARSTTGATAQTFETTVGTPVSLIKDFLARAAT